MKLNQPKREEKFTPVPDTLIADRLKQNTLSNALDAAAPMKIDPISGVKSTVAGNMSLLGDARRTILGLSLDSASSTMGNQTRIDKTGYMTALDTASKAFADLDIHDLHKARLLFRSMVESNPDDAKGWQGAARIEEMDGKIEEARNIIAQGVEQCSHSEDVWSEAIRLSEHSKKKDLAARAVKSCPKSIKLWIIAARLETENERKVKVLKKALQIVPQSEKLWRELIELASGDDEAKEFLKSAVECVPDNLDFRLALARLCPYEEAKEVVNAANRYFKSEERTIWVHASKLEESNGKPEICDLLISKGISKIVKKKNIFQRDEWLDEAQACEKAECLSTCRAIIKAVFQLDMKEHDFASLWLEDANFALQRGNKESARIMFDVAVDLFPKDSRLWEGYIGLESRLEERLKYRKVLERAAAVEGETAQPFLLRLSKELVRSGDTEKAIELLKNSLDKQPNSEVLCLAYAEILKQLKQADKCRVLLAKARETINTPNIWRYYIKFERDLGDIKKALEVSKEATTRFPYNVDIACDLSTVYEEMNQFDKARENYISLTKNSKTQKQSRPWIQYILFESRVSGPQKVDTAKLGSYYLRGVQEVHQGGSRNVVHSDQA